LGVLGNVRTDYIHGLTIAQLVNQSSCLGAVNLLELCSG
jgi:hypothetical protein